METPPPSYADAMQSAARGDGTVGAHRVVHVSRSRPIVTHANAFGVGWSPSAEMPTTTESCRDEEPKLQRVANTVIMFVIIFIIIVIMAKLTQHAKYVTPSNPHG